MLELTLSELSTIVGGQVIGSGFDLIGPVSIDTRTLNPGDCFIALRAERDGHDYVSSAIAKGAKAIIVDHQMDHAIPQLIVSNTLVAMQCWGSWCLQQANKAKVVGITGSVGKTSTKELLAAVLNAWKTPGNFNNTIGLPQSLISLDQEKEFIVLEMGMSFPGEIANLTSIAPLDYGIITAIGTAHIENFTDGIKGIAKAKSELVQGIRSGGKWVFHKDDVWCDWIAHQSFSSHAVGISIGRSEEIYISNVKTLGLLGESFKLHYHGEQLDLKINLRGNHQVNNAALVATLALEIGISPYQISERLLLVHPGEGRGKIHHLQNKLILVDESYNASPESIIATTKGMESLPGGDLVIILGCMRELGADARRLHHFVGTSLKNMGVRHLYAYGDYAHDYLEGFGEGSRAFGSVSDLIQDPHGLSRIASGSRILVKGSRYWKSELVVNWFLEHYGV